jgi:hypothetical protein
MLVRNLEFRIRNTTITEMNDDGFFQSASKSLTRYCGPGNWSPDGKTTNNAYFKPVDECCKRHDECDYTIVRPGDNMHFPGLSYKDQYFTRFKF